MATKQITAELLLKGVDRTGRAFASVSRRLSGIDRKATAIDAKNRRRIIAANKRSITAFGRGAAIGTAAVAIAGAAATKQYADSERQLTRIGITAEATREEMKKTRKDLLQIGDDVAMPYQSMVEGLDTLTAANLNLKDSMDFIPAVAATTQAAGGQITDTALASIAVSRHFKITATEMQKAFDLMVKGGEAGQFEFKDMAQYLPTLAPAMRALGYEGLEGLKKLIVELQVVREQTGTASEAATNFQAVLQKMETDRTAKKFAKFGIDLRKELEVGRDAGEDILDTFTKITRKALKGDLSKIPQLFADAQFAKGMRAKLMSADAAERYTKALNNADGSVQKNLTRILQDQKTELDRLSNAWTGLINKIGSKVAPPVTGVINSVLSGLNDQEITQAGITEYKKRYGDDLTDFYKIGPEARDGKIVSEVMRGWVESDFKGEPFANYRAKKTKQKRLARDHVPGTGDHHPRDYIPVPTPRPGGLSIAGDGQHPEYPGGIPIPQSRSGIARREEAAARVLFSTEAKRMGKQYAEYGRGRQIGEDATLDFVDKRDAATQRKKMMRAGTGNIHAPLSIETKAAEKNVGAINDLMDNLASGMGLKLKIDTSGAEADLTRIEKRIKRLNSITISSGRSSRTNINTGRSMPTTGHLGGT